MAAGAGPRQHEPGDASGASGSEAFGDRSRWRRTLTPRRTAALAAVVILSLTTALRSSPAPPAQSPSGLPAPTQDLPGWRLVASEDFNSDRLPAGWGAYSGHPGGNPGGWWEPSHAVVGDGELRLEGSVADGRWTTAGVMFSAATRTYGKFEVRFRIATGYGVKYAFLLWPASGRWPEDGEIDFAEDGGGQRGYTTATLHYGADNHKIENTVAADFTRWHTVGVEWTKDLLVYTLDGQPWATVRSTHVPDGPMNLAMQTEAGTCGQVFVPCPDATTPAHVDALIDWVAVFAPATRR